MWQNCINTSCKKSYNNYLSVRLFMFALCLYCCQLPIPYCIHEKCLVVVGNMRESASYPAWPLLLLHHSLGFHLSILVTYKQESLSIFKKTSLPNQSQKSIFFHFHAYHFLFVSNPCISWNRYMEGQWLWFLSPLAQYWLSPGAHRRASLPPLRYSCCRVLDGGHSGRLCDWREHNEPRL